MEKQIKVAVYEDNYALQENLTYLIKGSEMMQFAGAWGNCLDILKNCENERPDIIIMDIDMPYLSGIEATRLVKDTYPKINIMANVRPLYHFSPFYIHIHAYHGL